MDISLAAPAILQFGSFSITNTVLASILTSLLTLSLLIYVGRNAKVIPGKLQVAVELIVSLLMGLLVPAYKSEERARKFLPYYITLFLFLIIANQFSVIPLVNNLITPNGLLFSGSTADLSQTISLALFSLGLAHVMAMMISPLGHIGSYIKIGPLLKARSFGGVMNGFLEIFMGILDIVGEVAKLISLSARLFGNMFAGGVVVVVISGIASFTSYLIPVPFLFLGIFSGFVQAFVFTILSVQFMSATILNVVEMKEAKAESNSKEVSLEMKENPST